MVQTERTRAARISFNSEMAMLRKHTKLLYRYFRNDIGEEYQLVMWALNTDNMLCGVMVLVHNSAFKTVVTMDELIESYVPSDPDMFPFMPKKEEYYGKLT